MDPDHDDGVLSSMKVHWFGSEVDGVFLPKLVVQIGGKVSVGDEDGEGYRVYFL